MEENKCISTIFVQGTIEQIKYIQVRISYVFGKKAIVTKISGDGTISSMCFTLTSHSTMPEIQLKNLTDSIPDKKALRLKVESQNLETLYFAHAIYSYSLWSFEPMPNINSKIIELKEYGIGYIKKNIEENGDIDFGEDCNYSALYINDDGYAECPYIRKVELETNAKLCVLLDDGHWLYEEELTVNNVMDILTLLSEPTKNNNQDELQA